MSLFTFPQPRIFTTPDLPIVDFPADANHFTKGRAGYQPLQILLHHTGGTNSLLWLTRTSNPRVSAHRLISKSGINHKLVQDEDTAYCAGFGTIGPVDPDGSDPFGVPRNLNECTLNIEIENLGNGIDPYPWAQMMMVAWQIREWWGKYGFLPLLGHGHVDQRKDDPAGFSWALLHGLLRDELTKVLAVA